MAVPIETVLEKDPAAKLAFGFDWAAWLGSDTIANSAWTSSPSGLTLSGGTHASGVTKIIVESGTDGVFYKLKNTVTTAAGLIDERTGTIKVRER